MGGMESVAVAVGRGISVGGGNCVWVGNAVGAASAWVVLVGVGGRLVGRFSLRMAKKASAPHNTSTSSAPPAIHIIGRDFLTGATGGVMVCWKAGAGVGAGGGVAFRAAEGGSTVVFIPPGSNAAGPDGV